MALFLSSYIYNILQPATDKMSTLLEQLTEKDTEKATKAAVTWVIDVTGSMASEIEAVRDTLLEFADIFEKRGVRLDLGLISFRDLTQGEKITTHSFSGSTFTRDAEKFRNEIKSTLVAKGGGPTPESSFDAVVQACNLEWPQGSDRVIVLITDAPSHTKSSGTSDYDAADVKSVLSESKINMVYVVTYTKVDAIREQYLSILNPKYDQMFDLGNKDKSSLIKTIRNIGLSTSERTGSVTDRDGTLTE
jgi:Mg-chelatase subunit ChlD